MLTSMDFMELQVKLQNLSIWLEKLYEDIDKSLTVDGYISARYYDPDNNVITSKLITTIQEKLNALQNLIGYNINNLPSINIIDDVNFSTNNWRLLSSVGNMFISPISDNDKQEISSTLNIDLNKFYGLEYKLVIDNLPSNNKDDAILVYSKLNNSEIPILYDSRSIFNTGIIKVNNQKWLRVDETFRPTNIRKEDIYQIAIGNYTSIQLIYPVATISNPINGGIV